MLEGQSAAGLDYSLDTARRLRRRAPRISGRASSGGATCACRHFNPILGLRICDNRESRRLCRAGDERPTFSKSDNTINMRHTLRLIAFIALLGICLILIGLWARSYSYTSSFYSVKVEAQMPTYVVVRQNIASSTGGRLILKREHEARFAPPLPIYFSNEFSVTFKGSLGFNRIAPRRSIIFDKLGFGLAHFYFFDPTFSKEETWFFSIPYWFVLLLAGVVCAFSFRAVRAQRTPKRPVKGAQA